MSEQATSADTETIRATLRHSANCSSRFLDAASCDCGYPAALAALGRIEERARRLEDAELDHERTVVEAEAVIEAARRYIAASEADGYELTDYQRLVTAISKYDAAGGRTISGAAKGYPTDGSRERLSGATVGLAKAPQPVITRAALAGSVARGER